MTQIDDAVQDFLAEFKRETNMLLTPALAERYTCLSVLTQNTERSVLIVQDKESGEKCILKITSKSSADDAATEYKILSQLDHPAIPKAREFEIGEAGQAILIRDYFEGVSLSDRVQNEGVFSFEETLEIVNSICEIMIYLHRQNPPVIYKDIKPQNIIMGPDRKIYLIDFGISRLFDATKATDTRVVGSFEYASPEHLGFKRTDTRSDIFSMGRLISFLSTGDPFASPTHPTLLKIVARCTDYYPNLRFRSMKSLRKFIIQTMNPPTMRDRFALVGSFAVMILLGIFAILKLIQLPTPPLQLAPDAEDTRTVINAAKIPIRLRGLASRKPCEDCALSLDFHHWYVPDESGRAVISMIPYDNLTFSASRKNQVVSTSLPVIAELNDNEFTADFTDAPTALELSEFTVSYGTEASFPLAFANVDEVTLEGNPVEMTVNRRGTRWILTVDSALKSPGSYLILLTARNDSGRAFGAILVHVIDEKEPVVEIASVEDLDLIRKHLSGDYRLSADLDLSEIDNWTPIGTGDFPFTGTFDGAGHRITGLQMTRTRDTGFFGVTRLASIRNVKIVEPKIAVIDTGAHLGVGALVGHQYNGLIENCAILGGTIKTDILLESGAGGLVGVSTGGMIRSVFNSASVTVENNINRPNDDSYVGGIVGKSTGVIREAANIGALRGSSLVGGITAFLDSGIVTHTLNAGTIQGAHVMNQRAYPPAGIVQLLGMGRMISDSAFLDTSAITGATVWNGGVLRGLVALDAESMAQIEVLERVFGVEPGMSRFELREDISPFPIPIGIFSESEE